MDKISKYRDTSSEELDSLLETLRQEVFELRSQRLDSKAQKTHLIKETRRNIARVKTVIREKELA